MPEAFLDTTLVLHLSDTGSPDHANARKLVVNNSPATAPVYALRELLAGPLQNICSVHNRLKASDNIGEALLALAQLNPAMGRKKGAQIEQFALQLAAVCQENSGATLQETLDGMTQSLALKVARLWLRAKKAQGWSGVQPLGCFPSGEFSMGQAGELRAPSDSFNCDKRARCSAAAYMHDQAGAVSKLCDALHPSRLSAQLASKGETASRRAALKELRDKGPKDFNKSRCRALGDAYFAVMCPATSSVATTNKVDFEPAVRSTG